MRASLQRFDQLRVDITIANVLVSIDLGILAIAVITAAVSSTVVGSLLTASLVRLLLGGEVR